MDMQVFMVQEIALYQKLKELFKLKREILIKNDLKSLRTIDEKIMTQIRAIKSFKEPIQRSETHKKELFKLAQELSRLNKINSELIKNGIKLADKKLEILVHLTSTKTTYSNQGRFEQEGITTISQDA